MPIHFSAKRLTSLKTANVNNEKLWEFTEKFKSLEDLGEKFTEKARDIKKDLKELDKLRQDNNRKKYKNKDKEKDYEKEHKLISKINSELAKVDVLENQRTDKYAETMNNKVLYDNKMANEWTRHAPPEKNKDSNSK